MRRPSIPHITRLRPLHTRRQVPLLIRELLPKVLRDLRSRRNPYSLLTINILHNLFKSSESSRLADTAAVESNSHHFRSIFTPFVVQGIESAFHVVVEIGRRAEAGWDVEFVVVAVYDDTCLVYAIGKRGRFEVAAGDVP